MILEKTDIRGILFDNITFSDAVSAAERAIDEKRQTAVHTPNAEILQKCIEEKEMRDIVSSAELILPDGAGVLLAAKILGTPIKEKIAGVEFGEEILALSAKNGYSVYFLGGKPDVAATAAQKMRERYTGLNIVGFHDGYFDKNGAENDDVIDAINKTKTDILYVCLGSPAQEIWVYKNRKKLCASLLLCLGGSLDIYAGTAKRAPKAFISMRLEWLWRLLCQPSRLPRMMKIPKFIFGTYKYKNKKRKEEKKNAC